jgi:hypothetical protein
MVFTNFLIGFIMRAVKLGPLCTIKFIVTLTPVAIVYTKKYQLLRPNLCFALCLLECGVQVTTYVLGFIITRLQIMYNYNLIVPYKYF